MKEDTINAVGWNMFWRSTYLHHVNITSLGMFMNCFLMKNVVFDDFEEISRENIGL